MLGFSEPQKELLAVLREMEQTGLKVISLTATSGAGISPRPWQKLPMTRERWRSFTGLLRVRAFLGSATGIKVLLVTQLAYANGRCA